MSDSSRRSVPSTLFAVLRVYTAVYTRLLMNLGELAIEHLTL